ncbi:sensor domain-containing diguanylate cyclase [Gorillibacterium timonense]|uniref:sensor domain-containing diguanylate cyclase n=1 Tax=Gorillibacterium timonense TaxID=1689269 RepID=UPI00071C224D|nr:sensor domain-containing diguanylate cyclase [Gorillibacterium timonense]
MIKSLSSAPRADDTLLFTRWYNEHLLWRIKWISVFLLFAYPYFFVVDFYQLSESVSDRYRTGLLVTHLLSAAVSALFLILYRQLQFSFSDLQAKRSSMIIQGYSALCLAVASFSSLNSQLMDGNVDAYIIIVLGVSILLPIRPRVFGCFAGLNHLIFLFLLYRTGQAPSALLTKQINTTAAAAIAIFIVLIFYHYMTRQFTVQRRLKESEQRLRKLFSVNPFPLVLSRLSDDRIVLINPKASQLFDLFTMGFESVDASVTYPDAESKEKILQELERTGSARNRVFQLDVSPTAKKWVMINYEAIEFENEVCVLAGITDISELKKIEYELEKHATTDPLTDVPNRGYGMALLEKKIAEQSSESSLTICFADINDLKLVNDRWGHAVGDELILEASRVLKTHLDRNDFLFRYGGDEFILVFNKSKAEALAVWDRISMDLEELNTDTDRLFALSISYGMFVHEPGEAISAKDMIERADHEMYKNKRRSKQH